MSTKKAGAKGVKSSRSKRAGLSLPVGRIESILRARAPAKRVSQLGTIFLAGFMEYLVVEILELSGDAAKQMKKTRVTPQHLQLAINNDAELSEVLGDMTITKGGVYPIIYKSALPSKKKSRSKKSTH